MEEILEEQISEEIDEDSIDVVGDSEEVIEEKEEGVE